jgi:gliding motility-associated peptidyl-prolyl isomerase
MKTGFSVFITLLILMSCNGPEPRKPVQNKSRSFFKASIERSQNLLKVEEQKIQEIIKTDSLKYYSHTAFGAWYHYLVVNDSVNYTPKTDDLVLMTYDLFTLENDTLYSREEIGVVSYKVDKQELFIGLRNAVKLLKEGEKATFLFPSSLAFGIHGDSEKIGINVPLKATIRILKIQKQQLKSDI